MQLLDILLAPWAIEPSKLREMQAIYAKHLHGDKIDLAAIEARLGKPLANEQQTYQIHDGGVAVLPIEGVMAPKANMFMRISGGASTQMLQKQIESAMVDPRVRSMVLAIDSPGGSVFGAPELAASIEQLAKIKPIVTVSDRVMASAAYWVGSGANAAYISGPTVMVGSIGVVQTHNYDPQSAQGTTEISAGKYKRIATDLAPLTAEGRDYLQSQVDHIYTVFVNAVAAHRGASADAVLEHMADGRVFIGQQAIDAGLVDGFSTVDAMVEKLATNPGAFAKRHKAMVRTTSASPASAAPVQQPSSHPQGASMNRTELAAQHPELLQAILAEGEAAGFAKGAAAECARIQAIEAALLPGHETIIAALKFDGKSTGADAGAAVIAAERKLRQANATAAANEAPKPVATTPPPNATAEAQAAAAEKARIEALPIEERCKAQWEGSAEIRAEFTSLGEFTAYSKANAAGQVKQLRNRAAA